MREWIVHGNKELSGTINVGGAKNSLLAILPATIITKSMVYLDNVTPLEDTYVIINILKKLNVIIVYDGKSKMIVDARNVKNTVLDGEEMEKIRASYYFMGALLSLYKKVSIIGPGGCKFACRPIDLHLFAFEQLGCKYEYVDKVYYFKKSKIINRTISFSKVSVGATVNAILASCRVKGKIIIENAAMEPEIDDLINFLNKCGSNIKRLENKIIIKGVNKLHGCEYRIMEDRIEAGTYLVLGACIGNELKIEYRQSQYLNSLIDLLIDIGVKIKRENDYIRVSKIDNFKDVDIVCDVYPSIATDLQQPLTILLSKCNRCSQIKDKVYPSRYTQIEDLNRMGFKMNIKNESLIVNRSEVLNGTDVSCKDLRGGISLVLAALLARGKTVISNIEYIERGYYNVIGKLKKVGAKIYEKN